MTKEEALGLIEKKKHLMQNTAGENKIVLDGEEYTAGMTALGDEDQTDFRPVVYLIPSINDVGFISLEEFEKLVEGNKG